MESVSEQANHGGLSSQAVETIRDWLAEQDSLCDQWLDNHQEALKGILDEVEALYPGSSESLLALSDDNQQAVGEVKSVGTAPAETNTDVLAAKKARVGAMSGRTLLRVLRKANVVVTAGGKHIRLFNPATGMQSGFGIHSDNEFAPHFVRMIFAQLGFTPRSSKA